MDEILMYLTPYGAVQLDVSEHGQAWDREEDFMKFCRMKAEWRWSAGMRGPFAIYVTPETAERAKGWCKVHTKDVCSECGRPWPPA